MALYFCAIPVGSAIGFGVGGFASSGGDPMWRYPFYLEGLIMAPLVVACFFFPMGRMRDKQAARRRAKAAMRAASVEDVGWFQNLMKQLKACLCNPRFVLLNLGYAAYTFATGGIVYWGIEFITKTHVNDDKSFVSLAMGGITAIAGLSGTFFGGKMLDRFHDRGDDFNESALVTACKLMLIFVASGTPLLVLGTSTGSQIITFGGLFVGEFLILSVTSVVNTAIIWSLPEESQTMGMAICIIMIHCFGDVPATPLMGAVREAVEGMGEHDEFGNATEDAVIFSWRACFWFAESFLVVAFLFWAAAWRVSATWLTDGTPAIRASLLATNAEDPPSPNMTPLPESVGGSQPATSGPSRDPWDAAQEGKMDLLRPDTFPTYDE